MTTPASSACQCPPCRQGVEHPERAFHHRLNLLFGRLEENQRRWLAALEADRLGRGGERLMAQISGLDAKKKELIGNFKNAGRAWSRAAEAVNVHDFRRDSLGRAVPYGIYDPTRNRGTVCVGQSGDTPRFAVGAIARWWQEEGQAAYAG